MFTITIICVETSVKACAKIQATAVCHDVFSEADNWPLKCKDIARRHVTHSFRDGSGSSNLVVVFVVFFPTDPAILYM